MHGFEKKKEKHLEEAEKKPQAAPLPLQSMSEGPMGLREEPSKLARETEQHERERVLQPGKRFGVQLLDESKPVSEMARQQYEKSLKLEIAALKKEAERKSRKKKAPPKKKPDYGWKLNDEPPPPKDDGEGRGSDGDAEDK